MTRGAWAVWSIGAVLCAAIALTSYRYLIGTSLLPEFVLQHLFFPLIDSNLFRNPWLPLHVAGAATALLIGTFQFLPAIRRRAPEVHRWIGRVYVTGCLLGGAAGLILSFGASTGAISSAGFGLLAVLWLIATAIAWRQATRRRFDMHREWMIRSFALTLSAVTLRLYLAAALVSHLPFEDSYRAISFLCWIPNLLAAEIYIRLTRPKAPGRVAGLQRA